MSETNVNRKGNLLIAEDMIAFRDILVEWLEQDADQIFVANNGQEALDIVKGGQVDAVLTDITMPVMTGLQFLAEIRLQFIQTPVIVLTAYGDKNAMREALRLDATDMLEKPCEPEVLREAIKKALDYGLAMREMDQKIDQLYVDSSLPTDQIEQLKRIKRITHGMKLGFSTYTKKKVS